jgi:hypothetical protein
VQGQRSCWQGDIFYGFVQMRMQKLCGGNKVNQRRRRHLQSRDGDFEANNLNLMKFNLEASNQTSQPRGAQPCGLEKSCWWTSLVVFRLRVWLPLLCSTR